MPKNTIGKELPSLENNLFNTGKKYWKIIAIFGFLLIIGVILGIKYIPSLLENSSLGKNTSMEMGDFSDGSEKIPYDTKTLSIHLDSSVNSGSITPETVILSPHINGSLGISPDNKTITYTLNDSLKIGESYELRILSTVKKSDGVPLGKDQFVNFLVTPGAQALKIFPTGSLDNLSQNITVVFNTPMVALTNLDERDKLPCPLTITPKIEGRCVWTNTSILEYIPTTPLQGATHYQMQVANIPGLLHNLSGVFSGEIMTTPLRISVPTAFSPVDGITLRANFPISLENLQSSMDLSIKNNSASLGTGEVSVDPIITPEKNEDGTMSETIFNIMPKGKTFTYSTVYAVKIHTSLKPKYGTEPLSQELVEMPQTTNFMLNVDSLQNILDNSGQLVNTKRFGNLNGEKLPNTGLFFMAQFDQEILLDNSFFELRSPKDGSTVPLDIAYGTGIEYDRNGAVKNTYQDKKTLKITPKKILKSETDYDFVLSKKANSSMIIDETKVFYTAPEFIASDFKFISNTVGCIYTNNKLPQSDGENNLNITTTPSSRTPKLSFDYGHYVWHNDGRSSTTEFTCPQISGKNAYIVDLRLNPHLSYKINFLSTLTDEFDQKLTKTLSFDIKTGPIADKDRYLYSSAAGNQTQVIPSGLPIILGLLSVNTDTTNINICEMDQAGYISFLKESRTSPYPNPSCIKSTNKKIPLKNRYWTMTPTKIDIEKEVLGHAFSTPYVYINGYLDNSDINLPQSFSYLYIRSNLSVTFEDATNNQFIFASSYDGKNIPADLIFEGYKWVNQDSNKGYYEKVGKLPITYNATKKLYSISQTGAIFDLLFAKNANSLGVLNLWQDQASNYDFKYISGQDASSRDYLYIYPDRPLYQPADTVYFKGILRNFHFDGFHSSEVKKGKIRIIGGQGTISGEATITEMDVDIDANSNFHGEFTLPKSAPQGRYSFEFTGYGNKEGLTEPVYNNGEFWIESYKKPVFKVTAETPKPDAMIGETVDIHDHAEYYFGGVLGHSEYQYSVLAQDYYFNPRDYSDYHFSRGSTYMDCLYWGVCDFHDTQITSGTGILDKNGDGSIHFEYIKGETSGEQIFTYSMEVTDPDTMKTVNNSVSQIVHATDAYVGVMAPYWNSGKNGVKLDGVVLDYNAKGLAGKTVGLELISREWKNVKKEGVDGVFYNEGAIEETLIDSKTIKSDGEGSLSYIFLSATGGEYEIRASYTGSNGVAFVSSVYTYVSSEDEIYNWYEGNNTVADLTADKTILSIGDRAGFTLKTPIKSGRMLVSIEKDDGILDAYLQDITDTTTRIEFPILDTYIPNVYVKVFAIGQNQGEKLPIYKRALSVIKVLPDPKKLSVNVTTEKKKYLPGEKVNVTISVKDATGKGVQGANGSLSIVDESLLALAGNPQKNPFAYLYDMKRYLGVFTYTSLMNLVQKLEVKDTSLGEKGGAGEGQKGGLSKKKRGVFKDTAYWQADFMTDKNGNYSLTTPALPDNLTTWVIEALMNTKKSEVGIGSTHIQTTKNVLINDNFPRFLGTSDVIQIAPVIFNKTDKDSVFDVTIEANHVSIKNPKQSIEIKAGAQASVPFDLTVASIEEIRHASPQASKIILKATSQKTGDSDMLELTLPIIETSIREIVATSGRADPTQEEQIDLKESIRKNGGSVIIHYAATLLPGLLSGLDFLTNYPYGCIEQKLSTIMPQVYIKELYMSIDTPYDLSKKMIKTYISKEEGYGDISLKDIITEVVKDIPSYQKYNGGFGYWKNSEYSDLSLTLSIVERIQDLVRIGFAVPTEVQSQASKYIKDIFYTNIRPYCVGEYCRYTLTERLDMINGVLDTNPSDYEAYKMYQLLGEDLKKTESGANIASTDLNYRRGVDFSIAHARLLLRLIEIKDISNDIRTSFQNQAKDIARKIGNENIVMNPRGAFIGKSGAASRLINTLGFIEIVTRIGGDLLSSDRSLIDQMSRWIMSEKQSDGSWGSTLDTTAVIRSITTIERTTNEIRNINLESALSLDGNIIQNQKIDHSNNLDVFSTGLTLNALKDSSKFLFSKTGTGRIYYDIALEYILKASGLAARDEGFFLDSDYYNYAEYRTIEKSKKEEWEKYLNEEIEYKDLRYPKDIISYMKPLTSLKVGELVLVYNRLITAEPRDQVAFEGFVPSGSELVNPNLKTESQNVKSAEDFFEHKEWLDDRFFATTTSLDAGIYTFNYIFRPTHVGTYELRPSHLSEFYHPEVFGRTVGKSIKIEK